jgi:hypothetical protein
MLGRCWVMAQSQRPIIYSRSFRGSGSLKEPLSVHATTTRRSLLARGPPAHPLLLRLVLPPAAPPTAGATAGDYGGTARTPRPVRRRESPPSLRWSQVSTDTIAQQPESDGSSGRPWEPKGRPYGNRWGGLDGAASDPPIGGERPPPPARASEALRHGSPALASTLGLGRALGAGSPPKARDTAMER